MLNDIQYNMIQKEQDFVLVSSIYWWGCGDT